MLYQEELNNIKGAIDRLEVSRENMDITKIIQETRFSTLNTIVPAIKKRAEEAVESLKNFLPFHNQKQRELAKINGDFTKSKQKAESEATNRRNLKTDLEAANEELRNFKTANQLSEFDLESRLWNFGAILMIVFITVAEMLISYTSLYEYFDGLETIIGVNGGLSIFSSLVAMFAGQLLKISLRIKKEIKKYNETEITANEKLPQWIQDHPSVYEEEGKFYYKRGFQNFLVFAFCILCAGATIIKFITPLRDGNTMAWIITTAVIAINLIGFIAYEYLTYSGLNYPMRIKTDKKLRKVAKLQEKAEKDGIESVEDITNTYDTNKATLKQSYNEEYNKIAHHIRDLDECEESINLCKTIVITLENKTGEIFIRLKNSLQLPKYQKINNLF
ncbi:MAG: hypothetical protein LBI53_01480 [Candidatus Peribacteria bacterium]|jgi:hypothetical protein|nr:hypothetical protein [Candidatus Peribacteria bacterium]